MTKRKHSYVPFYMDDWEAATAHMPRLFRSVLFDICRYCWDKVEPVPAPRLKIMFADLPPGQGQDIVNALVEAGSLEIDYRGVFSPRALREGQKAFDLWERKSRGGRGGGNSNDGDNSSRDSGSVQGVLKESSEDSSTEPEPEPEPDSLNRETPPVAPLTIADVVEAWNDMARRNGLKQVSKMSDERTKRLKARIAEHGIEPIIEAIKTKIPASGFLLGRAGGDRNWKAHFDWLLSPRYCLKLLEGGYEDGPGRQSGWVD